MGKALDFNTPVGILGAGAMGSGITQVAAVAGHSVIVVDPDARAIDNARMSLEAALKRETQKGRLSAETAAQVTGRITFHEGVAEISAFLRCGLVVEAIVEDLAAKQNAFRSIEAVVDDTCILATNTSSLSVAAIASACAKPERVIGLHFFNPAPVLPLVEVVGALTSDPDVVTRARALVDRWGKITVLAADMPGFIVNRVARPFYGESLRIYEEGISDIPSIDWAMKEIGGFRMGPFELMDLIGNDVNFAVSRSVFEALFYDPRYRPSLTQRRMVEAGRLGRKSGVGYYDYRNGNKRPDPTTNHEVGQAVVDRVLAMLINEAAEAVMLRVASVADIDLAMTKGVNYPKGLLAWADEIGVRVVYKRLLRLQDEYGDDRYRPSALLRQMARERRKFYR